MDKEDDYLVEMEIQSMMMDEKNLFVSRRSFLAGAASTAALATAGGVTAAMAAPKPTRNSFPKNFRWGVATAGHQVEGNNVNSDFWLLENIKPTTFAERSGDACDSLHRYEEDIALLARLGFNSYRLSVEWARIEPTRGNVSIAMLDYYKRVLECCHKYNIAPAVTFIHSTAPRWFAEAGGWLNPESPALFSHYCSVVAKNLGGDMSYAFTMNEPQVQKNFRSIPGAAAGFAKRDQEEIACHEAAALATNCKRFITSNYPDIDGMTPQLIAGHEQGYAAIKAERANLPVGVTLNIVDFQPANEDSPYQEIRKKACGAWFESIKRAGDFTGAQIYRQISIPGKGAALPRPSQLPMTEHEGRMAMFSRPEAVRNGLEYVYAETQKPIMITENGIDTENDERRVWYINAAVASLHEAIGKGIPVLGYFHWSLMDNFEWNQGYKIKYGLVSVDRTTFKRTPKPSAAVLGGIARRNAI